jgi:2-hydroxycyclohexanecarboxyl-CoA dehydrogenase
MELNLNGHVCVVTGGASGIGRATATAFAAEGAHVALWDVNGAAATSAAEMIASPSTRAVGVACDVSDEASVDRALAMTVEAMGPVDHLAHAAAVGSGKST